MSLKSLSVHGHVDHKISDLESTVARLESAIPKLKFRITELKARRNLQTPISKLPAEILVEIILEGKRCAQGQNPFTARGCLNISSVCQSWRAIALSTPRLWSSIDMTSIRYDGCLEMLRRSKSLPLQIRYAPKTHDMGVIMRYDAAAAAVMSQIGRIRALEIVAPTPQVVLRFLHLHPNICATSLQVLRLKSQSSGLVLSRSLTLREMPSLRVLTLHGGIVGPDFPHLPALKQIDIVAPSLPPYGGQPMSHLLRFLQGTPHVETISITGLVFDTPTYPSASMLVKITLPKLSRLNISSPHINGSKIFDCLPCPASTCIHFTCPHGHFQHADLISLKRTISHFAVRGTVSIVGARINVTDTKHIEIIVDASQSRIPSAKHFKLKFPLSRPDMVNILIQLWAAIPLADAPSLTVSGLFLVDWFSPEWHRLLQLFKGVELLRFTHCNEAILRGLLGADDAESLPLPKLRKIHFDQCGYEGDGPRPNDKMWDVMKRILSERKDLDISVELRWNGLCILGGDEEDSKSHVWDTIRSAAKEKEVVCLEHCINFI